MKTRFSRRSILKTGTALGLVTAAPPGAGAAPSSDTASAAGTPLSGRERARKALQIRRTAALLQAEEQDPGRSPNGDETRIPRYWAMFGKTLPHNDLGEVVPEAYESMLRAIEAGTLSALSALPGGPGKLVNPLASYSYGLEGIDGHKVPCEAPPSFDSAEQAGEMAELYWMALSRDVSFREYSASPTIEAAAKDLSALKDIRTPRTNGAILPAQIFRHGFDGETKGPYLSQFLWMDIPFGTYTIPQRYPNLLPDKEYLTDYGDWLAVQRGAPAPEVARFDTTPRYLRTGRDLATYVWKDFTYQAFLNSALMLLGFGPRALSATNPYKTLPRTAGFSTFGGAMVLDLVARVANSALQACWCQKWLVHRKLRPEGFAARVHHHAAGRAQYPIHASLLQSKALEETKRKFGNVLLPQAYPEGSPAHPSFAAGHAAIAGACVTVLKALFDEEFVLPSPTQASADGLTQLAYSESSLTIGGELNKLAVNIGYGRHFAGIHFRSDARESLLLGEAVAIAMLRDFVRTVPEEFPGFELRRFNGSRVFVSL